MQYREIQDIQIKVNTVRKLDYISTRRRFHRLILYHTSCTVHSAWMLVFSIEKRSRLKLSIYASFFSLSERHDLNLIDNAHNLLEGYISYENQRDRL